ncbi:MAG TPA: alanine racemase [Edaphobacter sp.]|nr:alanine racemase [Edaphobacter sp.]
MKNWVEISGQRLAANYRLLASTAGAETTVLAVVKADAYGHGVDICAPVLAAAGAGWLGVTDPAEGMAVRAALQNSGIEQPRVLVMSEMLDDEADAMVEHHLTPVVSNVRQMESLARAAEHRASSPFPIHLEIDTGMARQGVAAGNALDTALHWLKNQSVIQLEGVMTHFASAEIAGSHQTSTQRRLFEQSIHQVHSTGLQPAWIHAGNSSTVDNPSEEPLHWLEQVSRSLGARAMVRTGLALYGYSLPVEREQDYAGDAQSLVRPGLEPVMTWKARVTGVREVEAGTRIGYNGTFTAQQRMRLALLPVGYADGLRRELSSTNDRPGGWVLFGQARAPIVGRVSMNLTIVDVTDLPAVAVGDEAVLLGEGITAEDHAHLACTIAYEILCGVRAVRCLR